MSHSEPGAHFDTRTRPYSDTVRDFSATNSLAQSLSEYHAEILHAAEAELIVSRVGRPGRRATSNDSAFFVQVEVPMGLPDAGRLSVLNLAQLQVAHGTGRKRKLGSRDGAKDE